MRMKGFKIRATRKVNAEINYANLPSTSHGYYSTTSHECLGKVSKSALGMNPASTMDAKQMYADARNSSDLIMIMGNDKENSSFTTEKSRTNHSLSKSFRKKNLQAQPLQVYEIGSPK